MSDRVPIWKKDDFFKFVDHERIDMDPSVVGLPPEAPLTWEFDWEREPFGRCFNIRLEEGEITCEVEWFDREYSLERMEEIGMRLGGSYGNVVRRKDPKSGSETVVYAALKGVSLMLLTDTPGYHQTEDAAEVREG